MFLLLLFFLCLWVVISHYKLQFRAMTNFVHFKFEDDGSSHRYGSFRPLISQCSALSIIQAQSCIFSKANYWQTTECFQILVTLHLKRRLLLNLVQSLKITLERFWNRFENVIFTDSPSRLGAENCFPASRSELTTFGGSPSRSCTGTVRIYRFSLGERVERKELHSAIKRYHVRSGR